MYTCRTHLLFTTASSSCVEVCHGISMEYHGPSRTFPVAGHTSLCYKVSQLTNFTGIQKIPDKLKLSLLSQCTRDTVNLKSHSNNQTGRKIEECLISTSLSALPAKSNICFQRSHSGALRHSCSAVPKCEEYIETL